MAKTYRITIEYTTMSDMDSGPDHWDWPELLDLSNEETFGVWVDKVETNEDHVKDIQRWKDSTEL